MRPHPGVDTPVANRHAHGPVRRVSITLLLLCFLGLGSGALRFAHDAAHARDDARIETAARAAGVPVDPKDRHPHDESNCDLHALLKAPLAVAPVIPLLVQLGLFVAFLTLLVSPVTRLRLPARIDCRGPPSCHA
jgi:hypothetical protein